MTLFINNQYWFVIERLLRGQRPSLIGTTVFVINGRIRPLNLPLIFDNQSLSFALSSHNTKFPAPPCFPFPRTKALSLPPPFKHTLFSHLNLPSPLQVYPISQSTTNQIPSIPKTPPSTKKHKSHPAPMDFYNHHVQSEYLKQHPQPPQKLVYYPPPPPVLLKPLKPEQQQQQDPNPTIAAVTALPPIDESNNIVTEDLERQDRDNRGLVGKFKFNGSWRFMKDWRGKWILGLIVLMIVVLLVMVLATKHGRKVHHKHLHG